MSGKYSFKLGIYLYSHQNYLKNQVFIHTYFHCKEKWWYFCIKTSSILVNMTSDGEICIPKSRALTDTVFRYLAQSMDKPFVF